MTSPTYTLVTTVIHHLCIYVFIISVHIDFPKYSPADTRQTLRSAQSRLVGPRPSQQLQAWPWQIKLCKSWSSFQLSDSALSLSVTESTIVPSTRMVGPGLYKFDIIFIVCRGHHADFEPRGFYDRVPFENENTRGLYTQKMSHIRQHMTSYLDSSRGTEQINTSMHLINTESVRQTLTATYLLRLLAMIKCSICSYQCDNWYVFNWRLACHNNF